MTGTTLPDAIGSCLEEGQTDPINALRCIDWTGPDHYRLVSFKGPEAAQRQPSHGWVPDG